MADESKVSLTVDVNDKAAEALKKLSDALDRATKAEMDFKRGTDKAGRDARTAAVQAEQEAERKRRGADPAKYRAEQELERRQKREGAELTRQKETAARDLATAEKKYKAEAARQGRETARETALAERAARQEAARGEKELALAAASRQKQDAKAAADRTAAGRGALRTAGGFAGGGVVGGLGTAGVAGAAGALAFGAIESGLNRLANAANISQAGLLTEAQKREELLSEFVPLYGSIKRLREAFDGTTERMAEADRALARNIADIGARSYERARTAEILAERVQPQETARAFGAFGGYNAPGLPTFDRASAIGQRRYEEFQAVLPAEEEVRRSKIRAEAGRSAAERLEGTAGQAMSDLEDRKREARLARERFAAIREEENRNPSKRNKAEMYEAGRNAQRAAEEVVRAAEFAEAQVTRQKEAQVKAAQQELEYEKALVEASKARLAVEEQRERRMAGAARSVGGMTDAEFEMAKAVTAQVAANPEQIRNLPPELRGQVGKIAPEFLAKEEERIGAERLGGAARGELKGVDDSVLQDFRNRTLQEVRARVDSMRADIRIQIDLNEEAMANRIAKILEGVFGRLKVIIDAKVIEMEKKIRVEQQAGAAAQG